MQIKIKCKGSASKKLSSLKILQGELKELSEANAAKLRKRIEKFGFDAPFFVYKNNILDGTQRLKVLQEMVADGWALPKGEVPVVEIKADSIQDAKERILGYVSQFGKLTSEGLEDFIADIPDLDFELLDLPDFDIDAFLEDGDFEDAGGLTDPDDVPEPPEKAITNVGDLWLLGEHRLLCGDSTDKACVERLCGGEKADMVFTDPPYGVDYSGGVQYTKSGKKTEQRERLDGDKNTDIYLDSVPMMAKFCDGPCYVWFADTKALDVYSAIQSVGEIHALLIWRKGGGYAALGANYKQAHEPCLYWKPKGKTLKWSGDSTECTIWDLQKDGKKRLPSDTEAGCSGRESHSKPRYRKCA